MSLPLNIAYNQVVYIGRVTDGVPEFYPYKTSLSGAPFDIIHTDASHPVGVVLESCLAGGPCDVVTEGFAAITTGGDPGDLLYADPVSGYMSIGDSSGDGHLMGFCINNDYVYIRPEINPI